MQRHLLETGREVEHTDSHQGQQSGNEGGQPDEEEWRDRLLPTVQEETAPVHIEEGNPQSDVPQ